MRHIIELMSRILFIFALECVSPHNKLIAELERPLQHSQATIVFIP